MQSVSSRIWTRVAVSISYDDNHYATGILWLCIVCFGEYVCDWQRQSADDEGLNYFV